MFIDVGKTISQNVSIGAIEYASQTPHIVDQIALGATSERLNLVRFSH
jgi:hydroxyethylthiazole kinase-like sugar kinase family protein